MCAAAAQGGRPYAVQLAFAPARSMIGRHFAVSARMKRTNSSVTIGIKPGAGGTQTVPRIVGERRAKEIILTGRPFTAADAPDWGILNGVFDTREALHESIASFNEKRRPVFQGR